MLWTSELHHGQIVTQTQVANKASVVLANRLSSDSEFANKALVILMIAHPIASRAVGYSTVSVQRLRLSNYKTDREKLQAFLLTSQRIIQ